MNKKQHVFYPLLFALCCGTVILSLAACGGDLREKLERRPVVITQTIPGTTIVQDQVTTEATRRNRYDIRQTEASIYQAIIVSDTIMTLVEGEEEEESIIIADTIILSFLEIDPSILGALQTDLAITADEYIEKQLVGTTFRMERGRIGSLDPALFKNPPTAVFDPANVHQVISMSRNSICVQRRDDIKNVQCFSNVERRVLVIHRNNRIEVYELPPNLTS